jgi:hypothetical protein
MLWNEFLTLKTKLLWQKLNGQKKTDLAVVVGSRRIAGVSITATEAVTEPEPTITNETDLLGIKENNDIVAAYVNFVKTIRKR